MAGNGLGYVEFGKRTGERLVVNGERLKVRGEWINGERLKVRGERVER